MEPSGSDAYLHRPSWLLSRVAFVATHGVFLYWLNFLFNDPFHLGGNTLDAVGTEAGGTCRSFVGEAVAVDLGLFSLWWATHSGLARKAVKQALGLWQHPLERPLYANVAWIVWLLNVHLWRPVSDCPAWSVTTTPVPWLAASGVVMVAALVVLVGFMWSLPGHVFGTDHYRYPPGGAPPPTLLRRFPYDLVRHPAAAGFLWLFWALPAYTVNHLFLAASWTVFIVVGTLLLEERALGSSDEMGAAYLAYRAEVNAFWPNLGSLKRLLGLAG